MDKTEWIWINTKEIYLSHTVHSNYSFLQETLIKQDDSITSSYLEQAVGIIYEEQGTASLKSIFSLVAPFSSWERRHVEINKRNERNEAVSEHKSMFVLCKTKLKKDESEKVINLLQLYMSSVSRADSRVRVSFCHKSILHCVPLFLRLYQRRKIKEIFDNSIALYILNPYFW